MSVLFQCYSIIIDQGISASGHGKKVVRGPNAIDKRYIYQLTFNVQLRGSKTYYSQSLINSFTHKTMMSIWLNNSKIIFLRGIVNMA